MRHPIYASPEEVIDIALEPGEAVAGTGPVAAGGTVRWVIDGTESGSGDAQRVHILVKPTRSDLRTNLVIKYRSAYLSPGTAGHAVRLHGLGRLALSAGPMAVRRSASGPPAAAGDAGGPDAVDLDHLDFRYRIQGRHPSWRPVQLFGDGR